MSDPQRDVVVVGAGPVGLSLALGLARTGRSVLMLEKKPTTCEHSRAPVLWPRTQEVLADLGVLGRFLGEGIVQDDIRLWDADRDRALLRFPLYELQDDTEHPQLLLCPQSTTEELLCEALQEETSAEVRFSAEVTGLAPGAQGVEVHYEAGGTTRAATGSFVAGCDGAGSRVREALGASFEGQTYRMQAALADLSFEKNQPVVSPRITRRRGVAAGLRIGHNHWRVIMPRWPGHAAPLEGRIEQAAADLFGTARYTTLWKSEFDLHRRVADPFTDGRVALAGDAAHLTSPVGGQGINVGIQGAGALRRALETALDEGRSAPLDWYESKRREAIEGGAVWATDLLARVLLARGGAPLVPTLRMLGTLLRVGPLRRLVMRRMALLDDPSRRDRP